MKRNQILLVNDLPGVGRVALSAAIPIFSALGFSIRTLPTALVSNTLDFGLFHILDTTDYMKHAINIWQQLGFSFDSISAGFLANEKQVEIIEELIYMNRAIDPFVVVDPIMGDNGKLYNGIDPERISTMASLCKHGNIVTPNMTEALMLTGCTENLPDKLTMTDCRTLINDFRKISPKSIVITSICLSDTSDKHGIAGWNHEKKEEFFIPYNHISTHFPGTGDVFSSVMTGSYLKGETLIDSIKKASDFVCTLLTDSPQTGDNRAGLFIEKYLYLLKQN